MSLGKSMSLGGVRITFSKSGMSFSYGVPGFRVTHGARGVYVTTGVNGFYYRQRLDGNARTGAPRAPKATAPPPTPQSGPVTHFESAEIDGLGDISHQEFIEQLNARVSRGAIQAAILSAGGVTVAVFATILPSWRLAIELLGYLLVVFLFGRHMELRRRRFVVAYDLSPDQERQYQALSDSILALRNCDALRRVSLHVQHGDWKRSGGALSSVQLEQRPFVDCETPPHLSTNLLPVVICTQDKRIYFFPDRLLVYAKGRFAAISYESLEIETEDGRFVWEESVPRDAQIVDKTWRFVRRDGGPDRRFNNNRQLPVILVAYLLLSSSSGLRVFILASKPSVIRNTGARIRDQCHLVGANGGPTRASVHLPAPVSAALSVFGLSALPDRPALRTLFRDLALRSHPDRFSSAPTSVRLLAEERMKEINLAYQLLVRHLGDASPVSGEQQVSTSPIEKESVEPDDPALTWGSLLLLLCGLAAVFALGRTVTVPSWAPRDVSLSPASMQATPLPSAATSIPVEMKRVVARSTCNLRSDSSMKGRVVGRVTVGTTLESNEERNGWVLVRPAGDSQSVGWVAASCLSRK